MQEDKELDAIKCAMMKKILSSSNKRRHLQDSVVSVLTDSTFDEALVETSRPVLVDFWAEWCLPCKIMAPIIDTLAHEYSGKVNFAKVNTDNNRVTTTSHNVMSIPNFIFFRNGIKINQVIGTVGRRVLESMILRNLNRN